MIRLIDHTVQHIRKFNDIFLYAAVGGSVALLDLIIFYALVEGLSFNYLFVNFFGFILGTLVNYFLCITLVFQSEIRFKQSAEVVLFFFINIISLSLSQGLIYLFVEILFFQQFHAKIMVICSLFFWNYLVRKYFVFHKV